MKWLSNVRRALIVLTSVGVVSVLVEGSANAFGIISDRNIKQDVTPVTWA